MDSKTLEVSSSGVSTSEEGPSSSTSTTSSILTRDNIEELSKGTFKDASVNGELDLSSNGIKSIEDGLFEGMSLGTLDLSKNNLEEISSGAFKGLTVEHIALNENKLKTVSKAMFEDVESIQLLSLNDNLIENIECAALEKLSKPAFVYLHNNLIETLPEGAFNSNIYTELILTGNKIKTISPGAFDDAGFANLNLSDNYLEEVRKDAFSGALQIDYLNLANNKISNVEPHALDKVYRGVQLNNNDLEVIKKDAFKFVRNIVLLNNPKLKKIEDGAFDDHDRDDSLYPTDDQDKPRILYLEKENNLDEASKEYLNTLIDSGRFEWHDEMEKDELFSF